MQASVYIELDNSDGRLATMDTRTVTIGRVVGQKKVRMRAAAR